MIVYLSSHIGASYKQTDGTRIEDITYPDSYGREFYALKDGSYVLIENGTTTLFGEAYLIKDGKKKQIKNMTF